MAAVKAVAAEVRNDILNFLMVRRTRSEIVNFFSQYIASQGLSFPEIAQPIHWMMLPMPSFLKQWSCCATSATLATHRCCT